MKKVRKLCWVKIDERERRSDEGWRRGEFVCKEHREGLR